MIFSNNVVPSQFLKANPSLVGKSGLVAKDYPYVYESHLFKVRPKQEIIRSATLVVFLNSKYGRLEIDRLSMQGNQANFSLAKFGEIRIPIFEHEFNEVIENIIYASFSKLETAKQLYRQSELLLLDTLGMTNFLPSA